MYVQSHAYVCIVHTFCTVVIETEPVLDSLVTSPMYVHIKIDEHTMYVYILNTYFTLCNIYMYINSVYE